MVKTEIKEKHLLKQCSFQKNIYHISIPFSLLFKKIKLINKQNKHTEENKSL